MGGEFLDEMTDMFDQIERNPYLYPIVFDQARKATLLRLQYLILDEVMK